MAMWIWVQIFAAASAGVGGAVGATAPTSERLGTLVKAVCDLAPISSTRTPLDGAWGMLFVDAREVVTCSGHTIQFRSTKKQSGATGSPVQGYTWNLGAAMDEAQDSVEQGAYEDVVARLRGGKRSPICATATAKDSPTWRNWRDALSKLWTIHRLNYLDTPFVHDEHWEMMRGECSEREWKRRGLALDVGPENMLYHAWSREHNLVALPTIGAKDITSEVLAKYGRNMQALLAHDPGSIQDYTVMLKAFQFPKEDFYRWYAVDELRTKETTSEQHASILMSRLRNKWGYMYEAKKGEEDDQAKVVLRMDPHGNTDAKTDRSVYLIFRREGFDPKSAAYKKGVGNGRIPKEARIEVVNTVCCNAKQIRRFFVATDERGMPLCPLLVESLELSERDAAGKAETVKKKTKGAGGDLSDPTAALGYALWMPERPRNPNGGIRSGGALG